MRDGGLQSVQAVVERQQTMPSEGDDDGLFLGTVVAMRVDADKLGPGGKILTAALDPIIYLTGEYWSIGERIGTFGFTSKIPSR